MPTTEHITYGPGGYDSDAPDGNVIDERTVEVSEDPQEVADREFREAVEAASNLAELKAALLGDASGGRAAARPS